MVDVLERNRVRVAGVPAGRPMLFAHGFGCDQEMWRFVAPDFAVDHKVVLFDHVGSGRSDLAAYDPREVRLAARATPRTSSRSAASSSSPTSSSSGTR